MAQFSMNGQMNGQMEDGDSSDSDHRRKRRKMGQGPAARTASPAAKPISFAAKMMAKMGYKEGEGLGATGRGRLAPVETQLRPTRSGLGVVPEKTKQAKEDEKREAAFRGEVLEDSEEEDEKSRKELKKQRLWGMGGTTKLKTKYRTAAEIEAAAEGLEVPNVLKSIIDATGSETKLLTSTAGLMTIQNAMVPSETESVKLAKRARRDLESFADEWNTVSDQKKDYELQEVQLVQEMDELEESAHDLETVIQAIRDIKLRGFGITTNETVWEDTISKLESLESEHAMKIDPSVLQEVAVAAVHPLFKKAMHDWQPLEDPAHVYPYLSRLSRLFGVQPSSAGMDLALQSDPFLHSTRPSKSTTPYESMLYTLFLPPIRSAITNDWDPTNPTPLITLIQTWSPILPPFILTGLTHNLIPTRLEALLASWKSSKAPSSKHPQPFPHTYIFPWLPFLPPHHLSPASPTGLFSTLKAKLKSLFQSYPFTLPPPATLTSLLPVLTPSFLHTLQTRHLLPRLATHLAQNLLIDPSNQDLTPLTETLAWLTSSWSLSPTVTAHLMVAEFFPKWHHILYLWLTNNPNYEEVREWFLWWKEQFPESVRDHDVVAREWTKGLETISLALDLGPENVATQLPPPAAGPVKPLGFFPSSSSSSSSQPSKQQQQQQGEAPRSKMQDEPITFRHILEAWCMENSLLFIPMREADPVSGLPLFRLTASATGKGGVVVFLRGDVVWVREGKGEGRTFRPVGLDEGLLGMAEGR
ncbi:MAG: hypothetical protein L6R40_005356 [Gallowayella cf. fulva]|nr:MAG: hypothetical protein L6R40_005356 [Xanthomendoza cf. fulva]